MNTPKAKRGFLTGVAAAGAAVMLALGGSAAAQADVIIPDPDATGTLNIHKFEQPDEAGAPSNGLEQDMSGKTPLEDVTFTVQPIETVDLSTNEGWLAAAGITYDPSTSALSGNGSDGQPATVGSVIDTQTTDPQGLASFENLPLGLYLVTETSAPAGVTMSAPFLVTVPLTNPEDLDAWMYDIHVYPKNSTTGITKTVDDEQSVAVGDEIEWTILADIPKTANPDYVAGSSEPQWLDPTGYKITDPLDERLSFVSAVVTLTNGGASLTEGADYTLDPASSSNDNTVTVQFTEAGLAKLGAAAGTSQVQVVLTTAVGYLDGSDPAEIGTITNQAILFPNEASFDIDPGEPGGPTPSNEPETRWGDILIEKVDAGDSNTLLEGAVFQVFDSEQNALQQQDPIAVAGATEFTTGEDGTVRISGLRYSDFMKGEEIEHEDDYRVYWLVEIASPDGYELLANPVPVIVNSSGASVEVTQIENAPHNAGFELPLTGAAGTWMFTIGGLLLIGGGLALYARRRKTLATNE